MAQTTEKTDTKNVEKILNSINKVSKKEVAVSVKRDNAAIKRIVKIHGEYSQMFSTTLFECTIQFNLSKNDLIVLLGYCSLMEYGNAINISQADVAQKIGIAQPTVARSIKRLKDVGIFYSIPEAPRSLYIHPAFIAKGDLSQFQEKIEEWERLKNSDQVEKKDQEEEPKQTDLPF